VEAALIMHHGAVNPFKG